MGGDRIDAAPRRARQRDRGGPQVHALGGLGGIEAEAPEMVGHRRERAGPAVVPEQREAAVEAVEDAGAPGGEARKKRGVVVAGQGRQVLARDIGSSVPPAP